MDEQPKSFINRTAERIANSFVDWVLDNVWYAVVAAMITTGVALWLVIQSGRDSWVFPSLCFAAGVIFTCLMLTVVSLIHAYIKARRRKALERAKSLQFVSHEKGYLDHKVNLQIAGMEFASTLSAIGKELKQIGGTSGRASIKLGAAELIAGPKGDNLKLRIASQTAAKLNKHSERMEQRLTKLKNLNTLLIESNIGYLTWFTSKAAQDEQQLIGVRSSLDEMLVTTRDSLTKIEFFRNSQDAIRGMSQELNTSVNRMAHVTDGVIAEIHKFEKHWEEVIRIVDSKLSH